MRFNNLKKIITLLFLAIFSILICSNVVFSINESPIIRFTGYYDDLRKNEINKSRAFGSIKSAGGIPGVAVPMTGGNPYFGRELNTKRFQDFRFDSNTISIVREKTTNIGNYTILSYLHSSFYETFSTQYFTKSNVSDKRRGLYIADNSDYIIGYCLLEKILIFPTYETNIFNEIKSLSVNSNYLNGELTIPPDVTVTFYEGSHTNFVERYGIAKKGNRELLFLDAFYPSELEDELEPEIISLSNHIIDLELNF